MGVAEDSKVLVIGLDGATLDLLLPLMEIGVMPFLSQLFQDGVWGQLETTYPPVTAPAWASFMTSKNPGKHGIYEFLYRRKGSVEQVPVNSRMLGGKTLWRLLSEAGRSVGIVNVPLTYPPSEVNGFIIGDFLTPEGSRDFSYPPELVEEVEGQFGPYPLYHTQVYSKGGVEKVLEELDRLLRYGTESALYLMREKPWDFFMIHFAGTDRIQHELWHILDPHHPMHDPGEAERYREGVLAFYRNTDAAVEKLVGSVDPETTVIVMSDHGFGPIYKFVNFNPWLMEIGFLRLKEDLLSRLKNLLFRLGITPALGYRLAMRLGFARLRLSRGVSKRFIILRLLDQVFLSLANVDWTRTKAYSQGNYGQLYVNLKGREPQGVVEPGEEYERVREELIQALHQLEDPENEEKIVERIFRREDLYWGPQLERAPDLCFLLKERYKALGTLDFSSHRVIEPVFGNSGDHRMEGFVVVRGPAVKDKARLEGARIIDVAPTILYLLGVPIPSDVDGRVLVAALKEEYVMANEIVHSETPSEVEILEPAYSPEESEEIKERLKGMGYWG